VTPEHARVLGRLAELAVLFLDADEAGRKAAVRAVPLLLGAGLKVRVVSLTTGKDPGDFFAAGATREDFETLLETHATAGLEFLLEASGARADPSFEGRTAAARELEPVLATIEDPSYRAAAITEVARELDLPPGLLGGGSQKRTHIVTEPELPPDPEESEGGGMRTAQDAAEEELLLALLLDPDLREDVFEFLPADALSHPARKKLLEVLAAAPTASVRDLLSHLTGEKEALTILLDLVERPVHATPGRLFDGAIRFFERRRKTEQRRLLQGRYEGALKRGDSEAALRYLSEYQAWRRKGGK